MFWFFLLPIHISVLLREAIIQLAACLPKHCCCDRWTFLGVGAALNTVCSWARTWHVHSVRVDNKAFQLINRGSLTVFKQTQLCSLLNWDISLNVGKHLMTQWFIVCSCNTVQGWHIDTRSLCSKRENMTYARFKPHKCFCHLLDCIFFPLSLWYYFLCFYICDGFEVQKKYSLYIWETEIIFHRSKLQTFFLKKGCFGIKRKQCWLQRLSLLFTAFHF